MGFSKNISKQNMLHFTVSITNSDTILCILNVLFDRTTFTIVANIVIFVCFLVLLTVFNNKSGSGGGSTGVTPEDKDVFWVSHKNVLLFLEF